MHCKYIESPGDLLFVFETLVKEEYMRSTALDMVIGKRPKIFHLTLSFQIFMVSSDFMLEQYLLTDSNIDCFIQLVSIFLLDNGNVDELLGVSLYIK